MGGATTYFTTTDPALKLGYSYTTCGTPFSYTTQSYLTSFCSAKDSTACASVHSCKASGNNCVPASKAETLASAGCKGSSGCGCIDPVGLGDVASSGGMVAFSGTPSADGRTAVQTVKSSYGTACSPWDIAYEMQYHASCVDSPSNPPDQHPAWCNQVWCYINMCDCDQADIGSRTYFTTNVTGSKLGYSYATCGTTSASTADYLTAFCSGKNSTECASAHSCTVSGNNCVPASTAEALASVGCAGSSGCECIDPVALGKVASSGGMVTFAGTPSADGRSAVQTVPSNYGSACSSWDKAFGMEYSASCLSSVESPPSWCNQVWCYIDMCNCSQSDLGFTTYFTTTDADFKLGYSYATCGTTTAMTADYLTTYCAAVETPGPCTSAHSCKRSAGYGNRCVSASTDERLGNVGCPTLGATSKATERIHAALGTILLAAVASLLRSYC